MAATRISKSSVDWAKFAKLVPKCDTAQFNAFKAKSDSYLMRVLSNPEKTPDIDWSYYKSNVVNKDVVAKLEAAYKTVTVPYPKDTQSHLIDEQEKLAKADYERFVQISEDKVAQCEELAQKFRVMIPYHEMTGEDFALTFPDWVYSRANPSVDPHQELLPGLTNEERAEKAKPDGPPYSLA